jgi:hypothetical protein
MFVYIYFPALSEVVRFRIFGNRIPDTYYPVPDIRWPDIRYIPGGDSLTEFFYG